MLLLRERPRKVLPAYLKILRASHPPPSPTLCIRLIVYAIFWEIRDLKLKRFYLTTSVVMFVHDLGKCTDVAISCQVILRERV